jgi:hypothetical protein
MKNSNGYLHIFQDGPIDLGTFGQPVMENLDVTVRIFHLVLLQPEI